MATFSVAAAAVTTAVAATTFRWRQPWIFASAAGAILGGVLDHQIQQHHGREARAELFFSTVFGGLGGVAIWWAAAYLFRHNVKVASVVLDLGSLRGRCAQVEQSVKALVARFGDGTEGERYRRVGATLMALAEGAKATPYVRRVRVLQMGLEELRLGASSLARQLDEMKTRLGGLTDEQGIALVTGRLEAIARQRKTLGHALSRFLDSAEGEIGQIRYQLRAPASPAVAVTAQAKGSKERRVALSAFDRAVQAMAQGDTTTYAPLMAAHDRLAPLCREIDLLMKGDRFRALRGEVEALVSRLETEGVECRIEAARRLRGQFDRADVLVLALGARLEATKGLRNAGAAASRMEYLTREAGGVREGIDALLRTAPGQLRDIPTLRDMGRVFVDIIEDAARRRATATVAASEVVAKRAAVVAREQVMELTPSSLSVATNAVLDLRAGTSLRLRAARCDLLWTRPNGEPQLRQVKILNAAAGVTDSVGRLLQLRFTVAKETSGSWRVRISDSYRLREVLYNIAELVYYY